MREMQYTLQPDCGQKFYNHADFCIGTGRMGLALHREYFEQLKLVQEEIGFTHIRGHGLFCDDMAIYQEYTDANGETRAEYNFTYLDRVMDNYREVGLRPFLELGFMPKKMASGDQTVFYWKGNVTPPKTYEAWRALVQALLRHLLERYGEDVLTWPIEVWNEPNLPGFWKDADKEEYLLLFAETLRAVKEVDSSFCVGGPAICGVQDVEWMQDFMTFCHDNTLPLDFVTRHFYTFDTPEEDGHYSYGALRDPDESLKELQVSRDIVDSFPEYRGIPMHITEFNTSYRPDSPVHDTTRNAAYVARLLARRGEVNESYAFFKQLQGECLLRSKEAVAVRRADGSVAGVAWNLGQETGGSSSLTFTLPTEGTWCALTKTVDENHANPLKVWHDLGEPSSLSSSLTKLLRESAAPAVKTCRLSAENGEVRLTLTLAQDSVVYFELTPVSGQSDRGYSYERAVKGE